MKKTASLLAGVLAVGLLALPAAHASAAPSAVPSVPECGNADLRAGFGDADAGMSHVFGRIRLANVSGHSCWLRGYGGLSFVGHGDGTQVGRAAARTKSPTPRLVLAPGQRAVSAVSMVSTGPYSRRVCRPEHVDGLRVYVPDATESQFVPLPTTVCSNPRLRILWHQAYRAA